MSLSILIFVPSKNLNEAQGLGFDHVLILDKESFVQKESLKAFWPGTGHTPWTQGQQRTGEAGVLSLATSHCLCNSGSFDLRFGHRAGV